ncbi:sugar ABC transporter ATP-binding protein [Antiquaquibacter oligotrophicus]|nr:sugar ABC transporter ATP-binding protein [Antiquaquibacter oligotrophicus]UDF13105.1 sugar ABC transporter ATP-binding protein [Antiquaquibacter oligotrophicus]
MTQSRPIVEVAGATVRFRAETALDGVDFRMFPGEVHSLMGENGAGKSTLIKGITGALHFDEGQISLEGERVDFPTPAEAQSAGIGTVYQEIDLLPNLSVAENVMLGREPRTRWGTIDWKAMRRSTGEVLAGLGLDIDPASALSTHSLAIQQLVAIARAISTDVKVLILDEPTSSLDLDEVAELFRVIRELKERGVAILFISHFLDQVYEICDRITVLRNGKLVGEYLTTELLRIDLVQKMLGRASDDVVVRRHTEAPATQVSAMLEARGMSSGNRLSDVDVVLAEGEVLGLAGLLGSGRSELARAITGIDRPDAGTISLDGVVISPRNPRRAIGFGLTYASEDRKAEGIISQLTVRENITLALQAQRGIFRRMRASRQRELAASWIEALGIRPASTEQLAGNLSGGNQQKVLLARLLALAPRILALDEPTRGIDIGAKVEVQRLVSELAENGMSVIFISAELEEVLRVSSRITLLRGGRALATVPSEDLSVESLMAMIAAPDDDE